MSVPRLVYFNFRGRAEPIRLAFHIGGINFDDHRIEMKDWPALKPKTPLGTMPYLEIDGKTIGQSNSCLLYAGLRAGNGLVPDDFFARAKVDEVLNYVEDVVTGALGPTFRLPDGPEKIAARQALITEDGALTAFFKHLSGLLATNGTGYFVGDGLTIADLKIYTALQMFTSGRLDGIAASYVFDNYPSIKAFSEKVESNPKVSEWNAAHP